MRKVIDYNLECERIMSELEGRPRLLLHTCCAPCLTAAIEKLTAHFDVTIYFYNPNIAPQDEFDMRLSEVKRLVSEMGYDLPVVVPQQSYAHYNEVVGELKGYLEGSEKCELCFRDRLEHTAKAAAEGGYDYFTTTLTSSPIKRPEVINPMMKELSDKYGVPYLPCDFKKKGGNLCINRLCTQYNIYRQSFCGCMPPRWIVGITGGIASGKSTLTRILKRLGAYTMDADEITHELQAEGTKLNAAIKKEFPNAVVNGVLDRRLLRQEVFSNKERRKKLEDMTIPLVKLEIDRRIRMTDEPIVVAEVPLLCETFMMGMFSYVINVEVPAELRKKRAMERDGITAEELDSITASQFADWQRRVLASVTISGLDWREMTAWAEENIKIWRNKIKPSYYQRLF